MAKIAFVSLFDEFCCGMRMLTAELKSSGHQASLICFKQFRKVLCNKVAEEQEGNLIMIMPAGSRTNSAPYETTEKELDHLTDLLCRLKPDIVGFGFTVAQQRIASQLTSLVKSRCGIPIIHGGSFPTSNPDWSLRAGADYVCRGEGDEAILELAESIDAGVDLRNVSNLAYYNDDGDLTFNPLLPLIEDLDALPFADFSTDNYYIDDDELIQGRPFPDSELNVSHVIMTTRGCAFHCTYCNISFDQDMYPRQKRIRERSIGNVIEEMKQVLEWHGGNVFFEVFDSIFTLKPKRIQEFTETYHREIDMPFWCYTHPATVSEQTIRPLAECPNCEFVCMGVQSASKEICQDVFQRNYGSERAVEAAKLMNQLGLRVTVEMITNVPGETEEMRRQNLDMLRQMPKPWKLHLTKLAIFPGYKIGEVIQEDHQVPPEPYRVWNALYILAQHANLTDEEIDEILANPTLRKNPNILEEINIAFENMSYSLEDACSKLKVERACHTATHRELRKREEELADIRYRKGFRHFIHLSDALGGRPKLAPLPETAPVSSEVKRPRTEFCPCQEIPTS